MAAATPPAAIAIAAADVAAETPRTETAPKPTTPAAGAVVLPEPTVMTIAMPIAPITAAQAIFPIALNLRTFFDRLPSISTRT